jgi:hypothetical protein
MNTVLCRLYKPMKQIKLLRSSFSLNSLHAHLESLWHFRKQYVLQFHVHFAIAWVLTWWSSQVTKGKYLWLFKFSVSLLCNVTIKNRTIAPALCFTLKGNWRFSFQIQNGKLTDFIGHCSLLLYYLSNMSQKICGIFSHYTQTQTSI